jgi:hypothetical protein
VTFDLQNQGNPLAEYTVACRQTELFIAIKSQHLLHSKLILFSRAHVVNMKISNAVLGLIAFTAAANGYALVFYLGEQCTDEETGTATINVTMSEPNPCGTFDGINTQSAVITPDSSEGSGSKCSFTK